MLKIKFTELHIELYFDNFPDNTIREVLKLYYWHWNSRKRCWSNYKTKNNIEVAEKLCETYNNPSFSPDKEYEKLLKRPRKIIGTQDLIIKVNSFYCHSFHNPEDVAAEIYVATKIGKIIKFLVPVAYCSYENVYFILEATYEELKKHGVIMHKLMNKKQYKEYKQDADSFSHLKPQSLLKIWGYSVSQADDYSDEQRHAILEMVIDKDVMKLGRVLSYLDFFISKNIGRSNMGDAVGKWQADREYVSSYHLTEFRRIITGNLKYLT